MQGIVRDWFGMIVEQLGSDDYVSKLFEEMCMIAATKPRVEHALRCISYESVFPSNEVASRTVQVLCKRVTAPLEEGKSSFKAVGSFLLNLEYAAGFP